MKSPSLALALLLLSFLAPSFAQEKVEEGLPLLPGDPAPELRFETWLKGEPIARIETGTVYVLEFWASWCGPCIEAMPHISELQKKHPDVIFLGANVVEREPKKAVATVKRMGDKIAFRVAADKDEHMEVNWLEAAGRNSLPSTIIVDKGASIAWVGHPDDLEPVLEKVLAGEFDAKALAKRLAQIHKLETALSAAEEKEDWDGMITQLDALIELETEDLDYHHKRKYKILLQSKRDFPAAFAFGNTLLKHFEHYPGILHHLARVTVDDADATQDLRDLALKMGQQIAADGHPIFLSTLAHVQWKRGENEDAIKTVQKAIDRSGGGLAAALQKNLDEYQKAKGQ